MRVSGRAACWMWVAQWGTSWYLRANGAGKCTEWNAPKATRLNMAEIVGVCGF